MSTCPGCGGVVGRDCFNPEECLWITQQQANQAEYYYHRENEAQNSLQLLKAEILKLKKEQQFDKEYCDEGEGVRGYNEAIDDVISKLSGV